MNRSFFSIESDYETQYWIIASLKKKKEREWKIKIAETIIIYFRNNNTLQNEMYFPDAPKIHRDHNGKKVKIRGALYTSLFLQGISCKYNFIRYIYVLSNEATGNW